MLLEPMVQEKDKQGSLKKSFVIDPTYELELIVVFEDDSKEVIPHVKTKFKKTVKQPTKTKRIVKKKSKKNIIMHVHMTKN